MHSNEPKLLPVALKISLANYFSILPPPQFRRRGGSQICEVASSLSFLLLPPSPKILQSFRPNSQLQTRGEGWEEGKNELLSFFPCRLSWRGGGCFFFFFFSWAAHCTPPFPPHPSQCLCKPPRSSTQSLTNVCPGHGSSEVHPAHEDCHKPLASPGSYKDICRGPRNGDKEKV